MSSTAVIPVYTLLHTMSAALSYIPLLYVRTAVRQTWYLAAHQHVTTCTTTACFVYLSYKPLLYAYKTVRYTHYLLHIYTFCIILYTKADPENTGNMIKDSAPDVTRCAM